MNFRNASGDLNSAPGLGEKPAIQLQIETRTDDVDLLPLLERKRMLIYPNVLSKRLNVKQVIQDFGKEWPGLPKGVKFDPSDEELLWHLLAEMGKGVAKRHPFINEFIVSLEEDDGLGNVHPHFLPGVKQDGSMSYFFHRKIETNSSRKLKRQKKHNNFAEICWHSIGKLSLLCVDGIHQGFKEVLSLYLNPVTGGNPVKTPWLMHQYCIGLNGAEEDLVVSKIFYEIRSKQDIQDSQTDSVDGLVAVVGIATPLQVAPAVHERLHAKSVSADTTQDGFLGNLGDSGNSTNNSSYDEVIDDDTCNSNDSHISMEKSCLKTVPEHDLQKHVNDEMFKTQGRFISTKSGEINTIGICSAQLALPIKIESKSFDDAEIVVSPEKFSNDRLNASTSSGMLIKVKNEPFEEAEASIFLEKYVEKLSSFPQLSCPEEGSPNCNLSHETYVPEDLRIPRAELQSTMISGLDVLLSETTGLINQHPEKDDDGHDGLLMSYDNSQVIGHTECFNQPSYLPINVHSGEPQFKSVSSSSSLNVKSEPVESSFLNLSQIPPCNTRGHVSLTFEKKSELYSDSPHDILDHVPLKFRLGISVSEGDVNVKGGSTSEEFAPVTPGYCSFGSVKTKESLSSRRKKKKTATDSVEKAMEEDAPGLLKVLLDRGILVEEIKLYGDLEDNDPLETSSSEDFEELETVMTKLFLERSSILRFTSGGLVKGSRAVYCLDGLISLIEQARYLRFRRTPIEWGWCRDLQSFIFVFQTHNRIVLERPEYGYATYFFELVESLPIDWQIKRLVKAMKLTNFSRTILLENKPLIVGEDLSEGEALVLEAYGWTRNTGLGTLLNYRDRVVHDRTNVTSSEWRAKIGKLLRNGYDGGRMVLANIPKKVVEYLGSRSSEIKMEL